jgi:hypothetical protein
LSDIQQAFQKYVDGLDESSIRWAEREFFALGKGAAMILNHRHAEWEGDLMDEAKNGGDIDQFLVNSPVPVGLTTRCDEIIHKARLIYTSTLFRQASKKRLS